MATIKSALSLYDGMTGPLQSIHKALNIVLNSFEAVQDASGNVIDSSAIQEAREELARAGSQLDEIQENIREAERAQDQFNGSVREGANAADSLGNKLKGILATVISIAGVKSALGWAQENMKLADTQRNAENQLKAVLANMGVEDIEIPVTVDTGEAMQAAMEYDDWANRTDGNTIQNTLVLNGPDQPGNLEATLALNTGGAVAAYDDFINAVDGNTITANVAVDNSQAISAYDAITAKASEIQGRGVYGDEIMIAGAAELATYFSDAEAIMSMMDTLSNYAMGMSATEGNGLGLDSSAMVQYATNLGKVMTGTYTAMSQKGFEFTDAQKAIIEGTATQAQIVEALGAEYLDLSSDMQAAAAINSVIGEAWDGLYDAMSNTPEGKIEQFNNTLGDVREILGNQVYPAVLQFFDVFTSKFPQIETVLTGFTAGLSTLITVLTWIAALGLDVATVFIENWGWIGPIIGGVAAALLAYNGYLVVSTALTALDNIQKGLAAVQAYKAAIANTALTEAQRAAAMATAAETAAQYGLNAALLACPVTWIVVGIIAIIAAIYAAVAAINKFTGTSYSATGIIAGLFAVLGAHIINTFIVPFWNNLTSIANFIGNVFNDPVAAVKVLFYDMALTVIGYIANMAHAIENVINKIPGVTVDITSGLDNFYSGLEEAQQKVKDESGWVEYVKKMDFIDYGDAATAGYKFGEGVEDKLSGLFKMPTLEEMGFDNNDAFNLGNTLDGVYGNTGDTAANTAAAADTLDYMDEDLAWMKDIAEREAINRYTTAEITVEQHNENHISKDTDLDGVMEAFCFDFAEKLDVSAEGVHE